ncbi:uncharacterized protein LOC123673016 [Harmonia axyridis]|uniref:uncharacterized protein LOC123673016 n=1 Tax=Harmonia axyridis TaxID=115357 RepID=UPI001E2798A7|nr:uncharacterized protein LOC123673016 [Harmonia axyridis]
MDSENEENGIDKSFSTLTNCKHEFQDDSDFQFETFLTDEDTDCDEDFEDNLVYSNNSKEGEIEISNFEDVLSIQSDISQNCSSTSEDWKALINSQNFELQNVMTKNREERVMLLKMFHRIKENLNDIQSKIKPLRELCGKNEPKKTYNMYLGEIGAPYFKTKKDHFCNNPNLDTLNRKKEGVFSIYQTILAPKWSKNECDNLIRGVKLTYNLNKQKALLKEKATIKRMLNNDLNSEMISQNIDRLEQLDEDIRNLEAIGINDLPPLLGNEYIDWYHISTEYLKDKHTAQECSSFWHIYLHPNISKSNWSSEENESIKNLAVKYKNQNWDLIAEELGTHRSGFSVFLHYSSVLCNQKLRVRFTEEEDKNLLQHVESRRKGCYVPWNTIAGLFPNRTKTQLHHRYKYFLSNSNHRTSDFSEAEDILIMLLVERFGRKYTTFTSYLPSKSYMQIKSRYDNHLRLKRIRGAFTLEEDEQILRHFNKMSGEITPLMMQMNRNRLQLRQRYKTLKEYFNKNPGKSLEDIPRRKARTDETSRKLEFLQHMVDRLKDENEIPTIGEIELKLGQTKTKQSNNDHDLDALLTNFFNTSHTIEQKSLEISSIQIQNAADTMYSILQHWGVNLQIPSELKKNITLDIIDIEILNLLRDKYRSDIPRSSSTINNILPPNTNSLIGLRGLLLEDQSFKKTKMNLTLKDKLSARSDTTHNEKCLFLNRFISTFMWSGLLSIESPNIHLSETKSEMNNSGKRKENRGDKSKNKGIKRKLKDTHNNSTTNKIQKKEYNQHTEQQRFSSRLRNKKQISETNEEILKKKCQASGAPLNENVSHQSSLEHMNCITKIQTMEKLTNRETFKNSKINLNQSSSQIIPSNLTKIDKSEIVKLLQGKKPVKIFKIQSIKNQDGSISTITKPSNIKINEKKQNIEELKKLGVSDLIALADNIKNNTEANRNNCSQNTNTQNNVLMDLNDMKMTLKNSIRNNSGSKLCSDKKDLG